VSLKHVICLVKCVICFLICMICFLKCVIYVHGLVLRALGLPTKRGDDCGNAGGDGFDVEIYASHRDGASPGESGETDLGWQLKPQGATRASPWPSVHMPGFVYWNSLLLFGVCCGAMHDAHSCSVPRQTPKMRKAFQNTKSDI
jgi:hypothetical protein